MPGLPTQRLVKHLVSLAALRQRHPLVSQLGGVVLAGAKHLQPCARLFTGDLVGVDLMLHGEELKNQLRMGGKMHPLLHL